MTRALLVLLLCIGPASCGFHLRGTAGESFALDRVHVAASTRFPELGRELARQLRQSGAEVVADGDAVAVIELVDEQLRRRAVTSTGSGSVAQYELDLTATFAVRRGASVLVPTTTLSGKRIYSFDPDSLVGNSEEEELLTNEMRRDVAARILRRVDAAVRNSGGAEA